MNGNSQILSGIPLVESPLFELILPDLGLSANEEAIARQLHEKGYAILDFPDPELDARIGRIQEDLAPRFTIDVFDPLAVKAVGDQRVQDAWKTQEDVRAIAANATITSLLGKLYGRKAFPFQTLNFPVGTQQQLHSDSAHFSSLPERFMCGVWLAMEDIHPDAGPLNYCPGSHKWPILTNALIGRCGWKSSLQSAQEPFEAAWAALIEAKAGTVEKIPLKKGQALIWAANLLHGGSQQINPLLTRWSQVTHYYFEDCIYYTPAFSDEAIGLLDLRVITDIATGEIVPNRYLGKEVQAPRALKGENRKLSLSWRVGRRVGQKDLPEGWDGELYLRLNPDVATANEDPAAHYLKHGKREGRRYLP